MTGSAWLPSRRFVSLLVIVAVAGVAAGAITDWLHSPSGSEPLTTAAEAVYAPDGRALGSAQDYDPAVSFPSALSGLPNPPSHLLVDAGGALWFPLFTGGGRGDRLYRYDPATDALQSYDLPNSPSSGLFSAIAQAPDGHVLVAYGYLVLDFDPASGAFNQHQLPQPPANFAQQGVESGTWVTDMTVDADGRVYLGRMNTAALTALDTAAGTVTEIPVPPAFGTVMDVQAGKDGVYLSNWLGGPDTARQVALLSPTGAFTPVPGGASGFAVRPDGSVYAATMDRGVVLLSTGETSPLAAAALAPSLTGMKDYLAVDKDSGRIWFAGRDLGTVGRFDAADGSTTLYHLPSYVILGSEIYCPAPGPCKDWVSRTRVDGLAVAPNGDLYFADATLNRIGLIRGQ
jgi:streptogramin lyase